MNEPSLDSYETLRSFTDKLIQSSIENKLDICTCLNKTYRELGDTSILHAIIDVYEKTQTKSEKLNLLKLAKSILELGADPNCKNKDRVPLLHRAISIKSMDFVKLICANPKLNYSIKQHPGKKTALQVCIDKWPENRVLIKELSDHNSDEIQEILMDSYQ